MLLAFLPMLGEFLWVVSRPPGVVVLRYVRTQQVLFIVVTYPP